MTGKIFINYRRGDDPQAAGRLFDRLQDVFEPQQLFLDVDNIAPGLDFVHVLDERVAECNIVLAVIGKGWIDARDAAGARRLDDPDDFVRIEITSALTQGKRVIPVLIGDTPMPHPDQLPEALRPLARRNAVRLTHERFRADTQGLIKALEHALAEIEESEQEQAKVEAERRADEQRRVQEAEAARRAEEEALKRKAEQEAQERAAAERRRVQEAEAAQRTAEIRRREAEAMQRAAAEQAFAVARHSNTVAALEAFLAAHPASALAEAAKALKATLLVREQAYRDAVASGDTAALRSFLRDYRKGDDADAVRNKLKLLQPRHAWQRPRPALLAAAGLATIAIVATLVVWFRHAPPPNQIAAAAPRPAYVAASPPPAVPPPARDANPASAPSPPAAPVPASVPSPQTPIAAEEMVWDLVKDSQDADQLRRFIAEFPSSAHRSDAERLIAAIPSAVSVASAPDPRELARSLQFELKRVGCFNGEVSGDFNDDTKAAWGQFVKRTSIGVTDAMSSDAINALRGISKRICPLVCPVGRHVDGELCIGDAPPPRPSVQPEPKPKQQETVVDARLLPVGTIIQGGVTTCGPNGCQRIPKNCHAVRLGRNNPEWKGMGGKIICP
jgi:TIR domain-containing protein